MLNWEVISEQQHRGNLIIFPQDGRLLPVVSHVFPFLGWLILTDSVLTTLSLPTQGSDAQAGFMKYFVDYPVRKTIIYH